MNANKPTISDLLNQRRYNPNQPPAPEQVIMRIGGKKVGTLQNLVTLTGKQKNGKSRYVAATIAAGITRQPVFQIDLRTPSHRPRIALFDTEQSDYDFFRSMQAIKAFAGTSELPPTFDAFNTREDDPGNQVKMIEHYLESNPDCSVIVLDGLLDLLISYNDERESKLLVNFMKRITKAKNCLMIGVMHRGKGNDLTVGHLGSMADRMAQSVLKVEKVKDRGTYCLSADFMRSDEDFAPVEIWHNNGHWEETFHVEDTTAAAKVKSIQAKPHEYHTEEHYTSLPRIFNGEKYLMYDDLVQSIKEVYGVGRNWAVDCVKHFRSEGLIYKHVQGYSIEKQSEAKLFIQA